MIQEEQVRTAAVAYFRSIDDHLHVCRDSGARSAEARAANGRAAAASRKLQSAINIDCGHPYPLKEEDENAFATRCVGRLT